MTPTSITSMRQALRCVLIIESCAQNRSLSLSQLTQVILAQCVQARAALRAAIRDAQN